MLRRHFLAITELDLWRLTVQQMRRDATQAEMDKREAAAIRIREIRAALQELIRVINEDGPTITNPNITSAPAEKRYRRALKRAADSIR